MLGAAEVPSSLHGTRRTVGVLVVADGSAAPPGEAGGTPLFVSFLSFFFFFFLSGKPEETTCATCNEAMATYIC